MELKDVIVAQVRAADPNVLITCLTIMVAISLYLLLGPPVGKEKSSSGKNAERFVWIKGTFFTIHFILTLNLMT
jgi:hypothetical protein